ncbi:hypothetical protein MKW98_011086, partial [Papaver atlanticum]
MPPNIAASAPLNCINLRYKWKSPSSIRLGIYHHKIITNDQKDKFHLLLISPSIRLKCKIVRRVSRGGGLVQPRLN